MNVLVYGTLLVFYGPYSLFVGIVRPSFASERYGSVSAESERLNHDRPLHLTRVDLLLFAVMAFFDLEANYLLVLAYRYTSVLSVAALSAWSIPCVFLLGALLSRRIATALRNRPLPSEERPYLEPLVVQTGHQQTHRIYSELLVNTYQASYSRIAGIVTCLSGLALLLSQDFTESRGTVGNQNSIDGDLLVLLGASLYAVSNLLQEVVLLKSFPSHVVLAMYGLFGTLFGSLQLMALEWGSAIQFVGWIIHSQVVWWLLCYVVCLVLFYSLTPWVILYGSATFFNMSLLTANFYAALVTAVLLKLPMGTLYTVGYVLIMLGIALFYSNPI